MLYASNSVLDMINEDNIEKKLNQSVLEYNKKSKSYIIDEDTENGHQKVKIDNIFLPQNKKISDILGFIATLKLKRNPVDEEMFVRKYLHKETSNFPNKIGVFKDAFLKDIESYMQKKKINLVISKQPDENNNNK